MMAMMAPDAVRDPAVYAASGFAGLLSPLPSLGPSPLLPGEEAANAKYANSKYSMNPPIRPEAKVRLLALYGMGGFSMSMRDWHASAPKPPDWLEVRLLELPGHGFRAEEALPPCSAAGPFDGEALLAQRTALASALAEEIALAAGEAPFALYGFSYGAILMYEVARLLPATHQPEVLCVAGRGAPHAFVLSRSRCEEYTAAPTDSVLDLQGGLGLSAAQVPAHMRPRAAALFRSGMLLGALPPGEPAPPADVDFHHAAFAETVPRVPDGLPVLAVTSAGDTVWPAKLSARWVDVAASGAFRGLTLGDVPHEKLMNHAQTLAAVFGEVAACARRLAALRRKA